MSIKSGVQRRNWTIRRPPILFFDHGFTDRWWERRTYLVVRLGNDPRLLDYQSSLLPLEEQTIYLVGPLGIEPRSAG